MDSNSRDDRWLRHTPFLTIALVSWCVFAVFLYQTLNEFFATNLLLASAVLALLTVLAVEKIYLNRQRD